ncbi:hypothetical protein [Clostridium sp.]|uniref:hypothetical protein n=1 Tax=Clostridium sp. TaxID=1506 RepID=UPI00262FA1F6|nr:hypothetical protein [Clostridium sp.]
MEKPILFNTEMVKAILNGKKTTTRRIIKRTPSNDEPSGYGFWKSYEERDGRWYIKDYTHSPCWLTLEEYISKFSKYHVGDIIYVRETWCDRWLPDGFLQGKDRYGYKADGIPSYGYWGNENQCKDNVWIPSIHMPKKAARIFLKVTEVRVERLQNITYDDLISEGTEMPRFATEEALRVNFRKLWDSTLKKEQLKTYGWDANPWIWVISFKKCENPNG